jgi:hypothetical protein
MKYAYLIGVLLMISACFSNKEQAKSVVEEKTEVTAPEPPKDVFAISIDDGLNSLARSIAVAIYSDDLASISKYMPTVEVARRLSPDATADKTDEEIETSMLNGLIETFDVNFGKIQEEIKDHAVDRTKLTYGTHKYHQTDDPEMVPRVLELTLMSNGKEESIPFTVLKLDDNWYVFEILNTTHLFNGD